MFLLVQIVVFLHLLFFVCASIMYYVTHFGMWCIWDLNVTFCKVIPIILCQRLNGWHYCSNQTNDATREGHFDWKVRYNFFETRKECFEWKNRFFYDTLMPICLFSKIYLHVMTVFYLTPNFLLNVTFSRWFTTMTLITFKGCSSSSGHCFLRCHTWKFLADFFLQPSHDLCGLPYKKVSHKNQTLTPLNRPIRGSQKCNWLVRKLYFEGFFGVH